MTLWLRQALVAVAAAIAPLPYRKARLGHHLTRYCRDELTTRDVKVTVAARAGNPGDHVVMLSRDRQRLVATCSDQLIRQKPHEIYVRLASVLTPLVRVPIEPFRVIAEISDGECSGAGVVSFCSRDPRAILIPDHLFVRSRGYAVLRQKAQASPIPWRARSDACCLARPRPRGKAASQPSNLSGRRYQLAPTVSPLPPAQDNPRDRCQDQRGRAIERSDTGRQAARPSRDHGRIHSSSRMARHPSLRSTSMATAMRGRTCSRACSWAAAC